MQYVDSDSNIDSWHSHKIAAWGTCNESKDVDSKADNRTESVTLMISLEVGHQPSVTPMVSFRAGQKLSVTSMTFWKWDTNRL